MIKIYFGPYRHSPAPELGLDERRLWFPDFHALKGYDRDFWTNNQIVLDVFQPSQIHLWQDRWVALATAVDDLFPEPGANERVKQLPPGRQAMACELLWYLRQLEEHNNPPPAS
jgi:hypothetical protein